MKLRFHAWMLAVVTLLLAAGCGGPPEDSLARISREKKIRVGYISYFDITFRDSRTGDTRGVLVDVLVDVMAELGIARTASSSSRPTGRTSASASKRTSTT